MRFLEFPTNASLCYLAEGAANVVYRFSVPRRSPSTSSDFYAESDQYGPNTPPPSALETPPIDEHPLFETGLLRLRKNLQTATSVSDSQEEFETSIQRLFNIQDLVQQVAVELPDGMLKECNEELRELEKAGSRPLNRRGIYLNQAERHGTLVADMSSFGTEESFTIELKPKWLSQSPSAPLGSRRCRTCALRALRASGRSSEAAEEKETTPKGDFCPLNLVSTQKARISAAVCNILHEYPDLRLLIGEEVKARLVAFLYNNKLLGSLKKWQTKFDSKGILTADVNDKEFLTAMTLRDCTLFLRISMKQGGHIEARLGDLDLKSPKKAEYWRSLEQQLIEEGWYTAKEKIPSAKDGSCFIQQASRGF